MTTRKYPPMRFKEGRACLDETNTILNKYQRREISVEKAFQKIQQFLKEPASIHQFLEFLKLCGYDVRYPKSGLKSFEQASI